MLFVPGKQWWLELSVSRILPSHLPCCCWDSEGKGACFLPAVADGALGTVGVEVHLLGAAAV